MLKNLKFSFSILRYKFLKLNKEKKSKKIASQGYKKFYNKFND